MLFQELVLENFGSYLDRHTINLTPDRESNRPIILIGGMNGGGKTTIMDALRLALYGARAQCSTRGNLAYSDFLIQSIHRQTPPHQRTEIQLAFQVVEHDEALDLRIIRSWNGEGKENLGIIVNEACNDPALVSTWDEYIENLLPLGISNLFLFDGEQVKDLAESDTPPTMVFDAIQSLLGLELSERLSADLDVLVTRKRREIASSKQLATIESIESKLLQQELELEKTRSQLRQLATDTIVAQENEQRAVDKFLQEGGRLAQQREELTSKYQQIETQIEAERQQLRIISAGDLPLAVIAPLLATVRDQARTRRSNLDPQATLDLLSTRDANLLTYLQSRSILPDSIDLIAQFLTDDRTQIASELQAIDPLKLDISPEILAQLDRLLKTDLALESDRINTIGIRINRLEIERDQIDRQIAAAAAPEEYQKLKTAEASARKIVTQLAADKIVAERQEIELNRQIAKTKQELANYTETNLNLHNNHHIIDAIAKVKTTLQIFKEKLTLKKINKLEEEVTECFRYLLHKSELVRRITIDSQTFTLSLYDLHSELIPKQRLSAGEKQLLAIALLWGLARVSGRQLPIAIDTPLGRLDSSHRHNLIERYFPSASPQVILLSTDTEIGILEAAQLRQQQAIAREYLLEYQPIDSRTQVKSGYFDR
jgi:DNA sulfur modification protein DndD